MASGEFNIRPHTVPPLAGSCELKLKSGDIDSILPQTVPESGIPTPEFRVRTAGNPCGHSPREQGVSLDNRSMTCEENKGTGISLDLTRTVSTTSGPLQRSSSKDRAESPKGLTLEPLDVRSRRTSAVTRMASLADSVNHVDTRTVTRASVTTGRARASRASVRCRGFHEILQELSTAHDYELSNVRSELARLRMETATANNFKVDMGGGKEAKEKEAKEKEVKEKEVKETRNVEKASDERIATPPSPPASMAHALHEPPPLTPPLLEAVDDSVLANSRGECETPRSKPKDKKSFTSSAALSDSGEDPDCEGAFVQRFFSFREFNALPTWQTDDPETRRKRLQLARTLSPRSFKTARAVSVAGSHDDAIIRGKGLLQVLVVNPSSTKRLNWDLLSMAFLAWDIIMIPFTGAFEPEPTPFYMFMTWFTMIFWTFDMAASSLTGFQEGRYTVMRPKRILKRYLKTWFLLDALIVGLDWVLFSIGDSSDSAGNAARLGRSLRTLRFIRTLRLIRLLKVKRILHEIQDQINTEALSICFGILKIILVLVLANHIVACCWYGIGTYASSGDDASSWVIDNNMVGRTLTYKYTTSLHWSLTQFTPASMEVVPRNVLERIFSVIVLLFAMITFSSFVSILTASMAELRNISSDETRQFWLLRRYLRDWQVSRKFSLRIQRYLEYAYQKQRQRVQAKDVKLLALLSGPLHDELKYETMHTHLAIHPLFMHCDTGVRLFAKSLSEICLARGDCLFCVGEQASAMFILSSGNFQYHLGRESTTETSAQPRDCETVVEGLWVAEAVLWTPWLHLGDLVSQTESQVMTINGHLFGQAVQVYKPMWLGFQRYAEKFVQALNEVKKEELTDLLHNVVSVHDIVEESDFRTHQAHVEEDSDSELTLGKLSRSLWKRANGVTRFFEPASDYPPED